MEQGRASDREPAGMSSGRTTRRAKSREREAEQLFEEACQALEACADAIRLQFPFVTSAKGRELDAESGWSSLFWRAQSAAARCRQAQSSG